MCRPPRRGLDDLVQSELSLLKIDVEGAELDILAGARKLLESRPPIIVESQRNRTLPDLRRLLPTYSFEEIDTENFLASPAA